MSTEQEGLFDSDDESVKDTDREILHEVQEEEQLLRKKRLGKLGYGNEKGYNSSTSSFELIAERRKYGLFIVIPLIIVLLVGLVFGTYKVSHQPYVFTNGTHSFQPTTILLSLDGFRADFLNRNITPALAAFIASGVSPKYILPSFPSVTFPNHFTLVTGLYPESHGIVSNQFWDPNLQEEFYYTHTEISMKPKWWNAEPLWETAQKQGLRSAIHMWPGSEVPADVEPTYVDKYNGTEALPRKVDRILQWMDLPDEKRPQLLLAYVPNVDADGHKYGPNSTEIRSTIADVDSMLTMLTEGLYQRNLTEVINVVVVSDHGMATTSTSRLIQLDDLVDMSLVDHVDGWPLRGLRLKNEKDIPVVYESLMKQVDPGFDVYTPETMPARYHFSNNPRIAPIWLIPKTGWAIVEKKDFDVAEAQTVGKQFHPLGLHGYDHEHPLMRAIFVARGPAFPYPPNSRIPVFQNIEVYNILCDSLGIKPNENNGTLHLPLTTEGYHGDDKDQEVEVPDDPAPDSTVSQSAPEPSATKSSHSAPETNTTAPVDDHQETSKASWWKYLHDELQKAKDWAKEVVESIKGNKQDEDKSQT